MASHHTIGPWSRNIAPADKYPIVFADRNTHVAQVCTRGLPSEEIEQNCNLIAAAPAMLAALERARFVLESSAVPRMIVNGGGALDDVVAAIKVATGAL